MDEDAEPLLDTSYPNNHVNKSDTCVCDYCKFERFVYWLDVVESMQDKDREQNA